MKITLNLTNGQSVSAFIDDETVEYLNDNIMDESSYDDVSEITDRDYVENAIFLHHNELVFIFDKDYDFYSDIESYEVDRDAVETEYDKEARKESIRAIYPDAMKYALDFFHGNISKVFNIDSHGEDADFLPILFTTDDYKGRTLPNFTLFGNQPAIYISLQETTLSDALKENIRHAVIQYTLWLAHLPCDFSSAEFASMGAVFDVLPYKLAYDKQNDYYQAFRAFYHKYLKSWDNCESKYYMIGRVISAMHTCKSVNKYQNVLKNLARKAESMKCA